MTDALTRLDQAVNRQWPRSLAAGLTMSLADGVEILATVERLHGLLADRCEDHFRCRDCNEVACDSCAVGEPGMCGHGYSVCLSHWPPPECRDCEETAAEETAYAKNDRPWGAPA